MAIWYITLQRKASWLLVVHWSPKASTWSSHQRLRTSAFLHLYSASLSLKLRWPDNLQRGVDRLGRAIDSAEEEMEASLRRSTQVHKSQLVQKVP